MRPNRKRAPIFIGFRVLSRHTCLALLCMMPFAVADGQESEVTELIVLSEDNKDDWLPAGKEVDAIGGDWCLRNSKITVVIAQPTRWRNANMTVKSVGGAIIDLTTRERASDQLSCFYPTAGLYKFHSAENVLVSIDGEEVKPGTEKALRGQTIQIALESVRSNGGGVCNLIYELSSDDTGIKIATEYRNDSDKVLNQLIRDSFRCDGTFQDGIASESDLFWCYDPWFHQAYGLFSLTREPRKGGGRGPLVEWLDGDGKDRVRIAPGESYSIERTLVPHRHLAGLRGNVLSGHRDTNKVSVEVTDSVGAIPNARVSIQRSGESWGVGFTDEEGRVSWQMPSGEIELKIESAGREPTTIALQVNGSIEKEIQLNRASGIRGTVVDGQGLPIPCKISFYGVEGTSDPDFGPDSLATAMKNTAYTADGRFEQAMLPGTYDVVISRGPEYDADVQRVSVSAGEFASVQSKLERVVDSSGWVSTEYHSHSSPSGDNTGSQRGRVLNLLAEQIEFAPCTEHNRIDSYMPHLVELDAVAWMQTCTGMELTGSPLPVNHQNAFPLVLKPFTQDNGGPRTDVNPIVQIERLAMWDDGSEKLVQSNHPNLRTVYGDANADGMGDGGFREMFAYMDVMEIHPPERIFEVPPSDLDPKDRGNVMFNWMQLLNLGFRIPGVVNTDAHYNFHGSGWLRNYVASSSDDPSQIDVMEMVRNSERGRIVMTTGPFLEVEFFSGDRRADIGDNLKAEGGRVTAKIRVQCANWIDVNRVQVFVNGRPDPRYDFRRRTHPEMFGNGVSKFEQEIEIQLENDAHLIVATIGEGLALGRVMGPQWGKRQPVAVANPVFVDVEGDGFQANGDDLDRPLPVIAQ